MTRRAVRRRPAARLAAGLGVLVLSVVALGVMIVVHLETPVGLRAAEHAIEWAGSETARGTVRVGRVRSLPPGRLSLLDYQIIAPDGEVVIRADEIAGMMEPRGLLDGQIRFRPSWFVRSHIRLTPGPGGQVNLIHASEVPEGVPAIPLVFQDIRLIDNSIHVALPGKPPITMRHVYGMADLHIGHFWQWRMDDNRGEVDLRPFVHPGFRGMTGRLRSDHAHPLVARLVMDAGPLEPSVGLDYHVPALGGGDGEAYFDVDLFADAEGHGVDETEEEEEARDDRAEAEEERAELVQESEEERAEGNVEEADAIDAELERRARAQAREERRSGRRAERGPRRERRGEPDTARPDTASAREEAHQRELSRERPSREMIAERERESRAELASRSDEAERTR